MMHWQHFLAGSPHKIIIHSKHQNLTYWKDPQKLSRCIAREHLNLMEFDFEIHHIPGKANSCADTLSRWPDYDQGTRDNGGIVVLLHHVFIRTTMITTEKAEQDEETLQPWIDPHNLKLVSGVWYKEGRHIVTSPIWEKWTIIKSCHDPLVFGHPGVSKTTQLVEWDYWWPCMKLDIADYVKGCAECQCHQVNNWPTKAPLRPIYPKAKAMPFETVAINLITKLPPSQGFDSILTVTNHDCTKAWYSSLVWRKSMQKEWQSSISNTCSLILDFPPKLSVTETHNSCPNSCVKYANWWVLNRTYQWHTILEQTDNWSGLINGSRLSLCS